MGELKKKLLDLTNGMNLDLKNNKLLDLDIQKVYVNASEKSFRLIINCEEIINLKDIETVEIALKKKFNKFDDININVRYNFIDIDKNDILKKYFPNIIFLIRREIPSSTAWIGSLNWKLNKNTFILSINNDIAIHLLKSRNIDNLIKLMIKENLNIDLNIKFEYRENIEETLDYNERKEKEENKLLASIDFDLDSTNDKPKPKPSAKKENYFKRSKANPNMLYGRSLEGENIRISQIDIDTGIALVEGEIFDIEVKEIRGDKKLYTFSITDYSSSIIVKVFANKKSQEVLDEVLKEGEYFKLSGDVIYDNFSRQIVIMLKGLQKARKEVRQDNSLEKRVELHCHTKMSSMDGMSTFSELAKRASEWGHSAIAITDHGIVQGFPEAMEVSKKYDIKVLYGVEGYLVNDSKSLVSNLEDDSICLNCEYTVFDIETTGLSNQNDKITEIGAVKIRNGEIIDTYNQLINPEIPIPEKIVDLTGITDEMVANKPKIEDVLHEFIEFSEGSVLVAHNASFDMGFIEVNAKKLGLEIKAPVLDTLYLARVLFPELKNHKLNTLSKHLDVPLENHHRAVDDAKATSLIFLKCLEKVKEENISILDDLNKYCCENINIKKEDTFHIIIFAKNEKGLKGLYKIISASHLEHFFRRPRILKSLLEKYKDDLLIGSACEAGELYQYILKNKSEEEIEEIASFYDFLEIQPIHNNEFLIRNGLVKEYEELQEINKKIVRLGEKLNKPVVATGDVHFLEPQDEAYRRILMSGQGFSDADKQAPLYLKTTDEMLEEFKYLGEEKSKEVVITNTNLISDMVEEILPIPKGTFPPEIEGSDEELRKMNYEKAISIYGDPLPKLVSDRLDREINSIIDNGYAVMYIIAQKLVAKSREDGYLVGSRGSVGSSFVATMSDITEVNPLPPHYICPNCKNSEFITDGSVGSGADLKDKNCPKCDTAYRKDGHDIPFEVFLGFEGDKEPDIDLNFASEYQAKAHKYTEELFGEEFVFKAGTIGTIADKTAYGFVKKYFDEKEEVINSAEINRLVRGCSGVKRTSGQHPGGIMVVPNYKDIFDFTPIQYPANDESSGVITTHFDYNAICSNILKLDLLGHDVPSIIKMLEDITGIDALSIPLDDLETMKIFTTTESIGVTKEDINSEVATFGIPEFGTKFVRQMLVDTKPTTLAELVRISGLSHGTDVWINNAQDLVKNGVASLSEVICTRDDIMLYLIYNGLDKEVSFKIMEKVRKGKGISEEEENYMRENNIPEWYIDSCKKIKYMFPKAHAVAYVMMSFRIAYFKVHYPEAFYATYFTTKAVDFDAELIVKGKETIKDKIKELEKLGNDKKVKEKNLLTVLEVALEMYSRGYKVKKVDLYKSDSDKFLVTEEGILPPLKALEGVGENVARNIAIEAKGEPFLSIEDLSKRTKSSKTVIEALRNHGCLEGMHETNQLDLFSI